MNGSPLDEAPETCICENCGVTFESDWSDEEAVAESKRIWGNKPADELAVICDDCFKVLMAQFN